MKRRSFLKALALAPVAPAIITVACSEPKKPPYELALQLRDAGIISRATVARMFEIDWPVGEVLFDKRAVARLTYVHGI